MIDVSNLSVNFGPAQAVRDASLTIAPGARIGIVGESGSGKSMLGLALMGMSPDAAQVTGSLTVDGTQMAGASERDWRRLRARRIAMIFQEPMAALNPLRRVGDTVAEPLRVHEGLGREAALDRALALFKEVGLPDPAARLRQFPHEISGGQRQRVLIALALACNPGLLIADEPTTALDANVALRITELLTDLSVKRQMALMFISHDLTAVARATTEIMVMYGGTVVERGPTAEVLNAPRHPYTKGLLAARPRPEGLRQSGTRRRLPTIPGTVPPLDKLPPGCRFAGRCPVELPQCATERPPVVANAACHLLAQGGAA
ncbi:peptide/nickel transport system ATP-binding protein [Gemmobacter megaterium]|uniref:Peptide/nickel transport system ATP-binding protein n=1 Tax=Gemmobacter megaterium TaxID=1086013 RepID=A0A1N7NA09_9RHOB|nr:ABC transporter ATP-binding protein [Gemmobacter megaterium]GGE13901.1 ABC transporter ATP-binding protein [Gemmobacter megaterium]SIS95223.1 peptide/nickel transport system ATP-binding protein [Gemmobacter megaterium]